MMTFFEKKLAYLAELYSLCESQEALLIGFIC